MALDLGSEFLADLPGGDSLFAAWLMFGREEWISAYIESCPNCPGSYAPEAYHFTVNPDIQIAFDLCQISVPGRIFSSGFE